MWPSATQNDVKIHSLIVITFRKNVRDCWRKPPCGVEKKRKRKKVCSPNEDGARTQLKLNSPFDPKYRH